MKQDFYLLKNTTRAAKKLCICKIIDKNIPLVEEILKTDPEQVNISYAENGNTALHVAALNGYIEIVRLLLKQPNIDTTVLNKEQKTAFDLAMEKGYTDISALLKN